MARAQGFARRGAKPTHNAPIRKSRAPFLDLPPELYIQIGNYLPRRDAVNISHCSKKLYHVFRPAVWRVLYPRGNDAEMLRGILQLKAKAKAELQAEKACVYRPSRPVVKEIRAVHIRLQAQNYSIAWEHDDSKPTQLGYEIVALIRNLPHIQQLTLDLRYLDPKQVKTLTTTLANYKLDHLASLRRVRFTSSEFDNGVTKREIDPASCGQAISAFCAALGPKVNELEYVRGSDISNDAAFISASSTFASTHHRRPLKRLFIARDVPWMFDPQGIKTREIIENVAVAHHKDTLEWLTIFDDSDYEPTGGEEAWNTAQDAVAFLADALSSMPCLRRAAFPIIDFPVLARSGNTSITRRDDANFEYGAVEEAMEFIGKGVLRSLPQLERVAFWSMMQARGVEAVGHGEDIHCQFHEATEVSFMGGRESWPMGLWGYRF
ncbi:hypothetical protein QBC41DRAFT_370973, partial [Cercophora samala]